MKGFLGRLVGAIDGDARSAQPSEPAQGIATHSVLDAAVESHKKGLFADAGCAYRMVLQHEPRNASALHGLGVIELQNGNAAAAIDLIGRSISIEPTSVAPYISLAAAQRVLGRVADAERSLRQVSGSATESDQAHNELGILLAQQGRIAEAHAEFSRALAIQPENVEALNNLANACKDSGELARATKLYKRAIALRPGFAEAYSNLGGVQHEQGQFAEAEGSYRQAIVLKQDYAEAWNGLGVVMVSMRRYSDAEGCFWKALEHRADFVEALSNLGDVLQSLDRFEDAEACCRRALSMRPTDPEALNNLAVLLKRAGRTDEAESHLREAVSHNPKHVRSYVNLSTVQSYASPDDAEASLRTALALDPQNVPACYNLATILLSRCEYRKGFALYENRFKASAREYFRSSGLYEELKEATWWQGESLSGKRLLVWTEQGFGDSLMTMRYLPMLKDLDVGSVVVACDAPLTRVMRAISGVTDVVALDRGALPTFDVHCSIMSLPHLFQTTIETVPCETPYLFPTESLCAEWGRPLAGVVEKKVGVAWAGSKTLRDDSARSIELSALAPLLEVKRVRWISLQKDDAHQKPQEPSGTMDDWMSECDDFMDTAALIDSLDLVISVDTAVVHLAGALGKPVWLLNRYRGDWRWGETGKTSVWYPTLRQFRQGQDRSWSPVIRDVATQLRAMAD